MNHLLFLNLNEPSLRGQGAPSQFPTDLESESRAPGRDLAWQRAMEHAQQQDLSSWFSPLVPTAGSGRASMEKPANEKPRSVSLGGFGGFGFHPGGGVLESSPEATDNPAPPAILTSNSSMDSQRQAGSGNAQGIVAPSATRTEASTSSEDLATSVRPQREFSQAPSASPIPADPSPWTPVTGEQGPPAKVSSLTREIGQLLSHSLNAPILLESALTSVQGSYTPALKAFLVGGSENPIALPQNPLMPSLLPPTDSEYGVGPTGKEEPLASFQSPTSPPPLDGKASSNFEPVRLYVEWCNQGVRLWLGVDGGHELPFGQIAQQMQHWLSSYGERLITLICNGKVVWREGGPEPAPVDTPAPELLATGSQANPPLSLIRRSYVNQRN